MRVFFDMDVVLAKWNTEASPSDLKEPGYFRKLESTDVVDAANFIVRLNKFDCYILSAYLEDTDAKNEKTEWCRQYLPNFAQSSLLFLPCGENKAKYVEGITGQKLSDNDILIDDYTLNLFEWEKAGGKGIKWLNGINGLNKSFCGKRISDTKELIKMIVNY